ncbi:MAG: DUF494 family protein [Candidatus Latescibacteria bacterium]|nr:DUF494 family protein [Candidatus Latescibacterota bacterium]
MHEKVMEILVYLMKQIQEEHGQFDDIGHVSQTLIGHGYTQHEVNTAFTWLFERLQAQSEELAGQMPPLHPRPNRVLHTIERLVISPEAYGYIIQLRELGLIDDVQTEMIIERAMLTGSRHVTQDDIKAIAASILLDFDVTERSHQNLPWYGGERNIPVN